MEIYRHAKSSYDPSRGFFSPYARIYASKMFARLLFCGFFQRPTAQAPEPIFTQNTSNVVVQRSAKICLFGVREQKFNIYESRDLISKFWDPLIPFERIEQSASNLVQRWRTDPACVGNIEGPLNGRALSYVT